MLQRKGEDCEMSLSNREKDLLIMDERTCSIRIIFSSVNDWNDCIDKFKQFHVKYFAQYKACEREFLVVSKKKIIVQT